MESRASANVFLKMGAQFWWVDCVFESVSQLVWNALHII